MGMPSEVMSLQSYAEKVLLHNKLIDEAGLKEVCEIISDRNDTELLQFLENEGKISEKHAAAIRKMYENYLQKNKPEQNRPKPETEHSVPVQSSVSESRTFSLSKCKIWPFIQEAIRNQASDLHLHPNSVPYIRKHGNLFPIGATVQNQDDLKGLLFEFLTAEQQAILKKEYTLDFCLSHESRRFRCCIVKERSGWECAIRLIPEKLPAFEDLGLPSELLQLMEYNEGLVLITGPAGSGKSTTLAALVDLINQTRNTHIITLEEPIEYVIPPEKAHISQREVGLHTASYAAALRAALREDPDIIAVGELRDRETTMLAVTAAETGHLVFATLHTTSAAQTIHSLLDFFPPEQRNQIRAMISESLHGVICQQLLPNKSGSGMVLATELLFIITSIANLIREDKIFQIPNMIQLNARRGMQLMDDSLKKLLDAELITGEEAYFAANKKENFSGFSPALQNNTEEEAVHGEN